MYTPQAFPLPDLPPRWPVSISRIKSYPLCSNSIAIYCWTLLYCDSLYPVHTPCVYKYIYLAKKSFEFSDVTTKRNLSECPGVPTYVREFPRINPVWVHVTHTI